MTFRLELHPAAVAEATAVRRWYAERDPDVADGFIEALDRAIAQIAEAPLRWPPYVEGTRRLLTRRFPFSIIYRISGDSVLIVAIAHQRQRPGYWSPR